MYKYVRLLAGSSLLVILMMPAMNPGPAAAASATEIDRNVDSALQKLYAKIPSAKELSAKAKGILVFPSIVIVDKGVAKSMTTTTAKAEIYAFFFDQKGLMGGLGLQGIKITKIDKQ